MTANGQRDVSGVESRMKEAHARKSVDGYTEDS